jgi:hypothetical protein
MDSSGDTIVNARPLMIDYNFYLSEIDSSGSTKIFGVTLVFSSTSGLRIYMNIKVRCPSSLRFERLLYGNYSLVEMIQNPPERPGTVALCFAHVDKPKGIQRIRYIPADTDVSFFCALPNGEGVYVDNFSPTTVLEVFMEKWFKKYSECIKQRD